MFEAGRMCLELARKDQRGRGTSLRRRYEEVLGIVRTVRFTADGRVSEIVMAPDGDIGEDLLRVLWSAHENDIDIVPIQAVHEQTLQRLQIRYMKPAQDRSGSRSA